MFHAIVHRETLMPANDNEAECERNSGLLISIRENERLILELLNWQ